MKITRMMAVTVLAIGATWPAAADIKVGASVSASGPASLMGDPQAKTLEMVVEQINAAGGINGEEVQLVLYDDGGDPNKARTFATRLVEDDEVVAIVGGTLTGTSMSILAIAEEAEIPYISLAGAVDIINPVKPFTFKTPHTDRMGCQKIFEDMKKREISRIAIISSTDGFGSSMRAQCLDVRQDYGVEILADETYGPADPDMTAQLTKIRNTDGVQAILNPGFGQSGAVLVRNYRQLGIDIPFYASHGVAAPGYIDLAGADAVEGVRLPGTAVLVADLLVDGDPQKPVVDAYKATFEAKTGTTVGTFGAYAHDALMIVADALRRAGSADPAAIRDAIESTKSLAGTTGIYTFSPEDHLGLDLSAFRMLEIRGGKWTLIE